MRIVLAALLLPGLALAQGTPVPAPAPSPPDAWLPRNTADLVLLEKVRAQPSTVSVRTGQSTTFGTLTVLVRSCATRPPDLPQNSAAFIEATDSRGTAPVYKGWILSNTPAVSQFEHPIYDVRLVACR